MLRVLIAALWLAFVTPVAQAVPHAMPLAADQAAQHAMDGCPDHTGNVVAADDHACDGQSQCQCDAVCHMPAATASDASPQPDAPSAGAGSSLNASRIPGLHSPPYRPPAA